MHPDAERPVCYAMGNLPQSMHCRAGDGRDASCASGKKDQRRKLLPMYGFSKQKNQGKDI
jgi:hypothetical protein